MSTFGTRRSLLLLLFRFLFYSHYNVVVSIPDGLLLSSLDLGLCEETRCSSFGVWTEPSWQFDVGIIKVIPKGCIDPMVVVLLLPLCAFLLHILQKCPTAELHMQIIWKVVSIASIENAAVVQFGRSIPHQPPQYQLHSWVLQQLEAWLEIDRDSVNSNNCCHTSGVVPSCRFVRSKT